MHWQERIDHYVQKTGFPRSLFLGADGRAVGTWIMGNDYRVKSAYYGRADPPYSIEGADRYQTSMVKRNSVMRALQRLAPGVHVA